MRKPDYERGDVQLWQGDCLEILPELSGVDAVVTDPPYGTNVTDWDSSIESAAFRECCRVASGYAVFFYSNTRLWHILNELRACGRDCWTLVWHKSNAMGFERRFAPQWVPIVCAYNGHPPFWGQDLYACGITVQSDTGDHPTPKQLGITQWLVEHAAADGDTILDPFMGSGTTGVACIRTGRKFIGIELEPKYFAIARDRIDRELDQGRLFKPEPRPVERQRELIA